MLATSTPVLNLVQMVSKGASMEISEMNECFNKFAPPFSGTHLQVRPVDEFSRMMDQTTRTRTSTVSYTHLTLPTILRV